MENKRQKESAHTFPAGEYYVGDLMYVMRGPIRDKMWEVQNEDVSEHGKRIAPDCYQLSDGMTYCELRTGADGGYIDSKGREYDVDSASIGCVETKYLEPYKTHPEYYAKSGHIIRFDEPFTCSYGENAIFFGKEVSISWGDADESDEEEEGDDLQRIKLVEETREVSYLFLDEDKNRAILTIQVEVLTVPKEIRRMTTKAEFFANLSHSERDRIQAEAFRYLMGVVSASDTEKEAKLGPSTYVGDLFYRGESEDRW
jgi:hypothetical protein